MSRLPASMRPMPLGAADRYAPWIVLALSLGYLASFPAHGAAILIVIPIVAASWFFGLRGALVSNLAGFALNLLLIDRYVTAVTWRTLFGGWAENFILLGHAAALAAALGVGQLRRALRAGSEIEASLRMSEMRYRAIVEDQTDLVCRMKTDGTITYVNRSYLDFFATNRAEAVGARFPNWADLEALSPALPIVTIDEYLPRAGGGGRWLQWICRAIVQDDRLAEIQAVGRDITQRKRAEDQLLHSERELTEIQEIARIGSWEWEIGSNRVRWSGVLQEVFGLDASTSQPETLEQVLAYIHPGDRGRVQQALQEDLAKGSSIDIEFRVLRRDGIVKHLHTRGRIIAGEDGRPWRVLGSSQDVTESKQAQAALIARSRELEALFSISAHLRTARTREELLPLVLREAERVLGTEAGAILLLDPYGAHLVFAEAAGMLAPRLGSRVPLEGTIPGRVVSERRALLSENDPAGSFGAAGPAVYVPVQSEAGVLGVLVSLRIDSPAAFQPEDIRLLTAIGEITGNALRRIGLYDEALGRLEQMQALHNIDLAITSTLDLKQILDVLLAETVAQLKADAAAVLLLDPATSRLRYSAGRGFRGTGIERTSLAVGEGYAGRTAAARRPIAVRDVKSDPDFRNEGVFAGEDFRSYFCEPLIAKGNVIGVLEVFHRTPFVPAPEWMDFLATLATQAAISIDNAGLLETTRRVLNETNALYHISQGLAAPILPGQLMKEVIDLLQKTFGYDHVQIYITDPRNFDLLLGEGSGEAGLQLKQQGFLLPAGDGIAGHVAETGQPFMTNNVDEVIFHRANPLLPDVRSEMALPIKIDGRVVGILDIQHRSPDYLNDRHLQMMSAVANQLAVALQKANLYAELQQALSHEKAMRDQLVQSERLTVMGRLLASVSHELNNPLQAIQNALYLLREERGISDQGRQDLDIVLSESERMAAMIDRLRATYRPTQIEDFQPVQLNTIVEDVYALISTHLRHNRIAFEFQPCPGLPPIPGLADQLRQVILNLAMNAVEAMTDGGQLSVITHHLPAERRVLLEVADSGPGIDPAILPDIFEPFITNKPSGTGLGLTISYDIIQKHGGRLEAENRPGGGAVLRAWLPTRGAEAS